MPRTYIKKKPRPSYGLTNLENAIIDVRNKNKTYREAQDFYGVPISVIYNRIKGRQCSIHRMGAGRPTELSREIEDILVKCLIARLEMGFPCDKQELKYLVKEFIEANHYETRFRSGLPGDDWYQGFMHRHPVISLKNPEYLQNIRKTARNPFVVYCFYDIVRKIYAEHSVDDQYSSLIFNAGETGFYEDPCKMRALGEKGIAFSMLSDGSCRESTTVLACVSASGEYLPPLIVYKGLSVQTCWISLNAYPGTIYAATSNGGMEETTFFDWISSLFIPYVDIVRKQNKLEHKTAILFYNGHASHISIRIIELAIQSRIQIIKLPSHLTDKFQPLDKCVFGPLKTTWDKLLINHVITKIGVSPTRLSEGEFSTLLGKAWITIKPESIVSEFFSSGLFPLDESKFPVDLFDPYDLDSYKAHKRISHKTINREAGFMVDLKNTSTLPNNQDNNIITTCLISTPEENDQENEIVLDLSCEKKKSRN